MTKKRTGTATAARPWKPDSCRGTRTPKATTSDALAQSAGNRRARSEYGSNSLKASIVSPVARELLRHRRTLSRTLAQVDQVALARCTGGVRLSMSRFQCLDVTT